MCWEMLGAVGLGVEECCQLRKLPSGTFDNRIINLKSCPFPQGTVNVEGKNKNNCLKRHIIVVFMSVFLQLVWILIPQFKTG